MAKRPPDPRWSTEADVAEIRIAVVQAPAAPRRHRAGTPRPWRALIVLVVVVGALAAGLSILGGSHPGSRSDRRVGSRPLTPVAARAPGVPGVAGAYGHPERCLTITIPPDAPTYARADFDRRQSCGRYAGSATAIFHRRDGAWSMVLNAVAYSCPVASIPLSVQDELGVCDASGR